MVDPKLVFLAGTCAGSTWREPFKSALLEAGFTPYDPQLPPGQDWTEADGQKEKEAFAKAQVILFVITGEAPGLGTLAEISWMPLLARTRGQSLIVCIEPHLRRDVNDWRNEALERTKKMGITPAKNRDEALGQTLQALKTPQVLAPIRQFGKAESSWQVTELKQLYAAPAKACDALKQGPFALTIDSSQILGKVDPALHEDAKRAIKLSRQYALECGCTVVIK